MKNIVVVSLNDNLAKNFAIELSKLLKYNYIDANSNFDDYLLATADNPLNLIDDILQETETNLLKGLSKENNAVIGISNDMFLSNSHFKLFVNSKIVLLECENLSKINKKMQSFMQNVATISAPANTTATELIKLLKDKK